MFSRRVLLKSALLLPVLPRLLSKVAGAGELASPNAPWLEAIARQLQAEFNIPAVWLAVNIEGKVEAAAVGVRKIGDPAPATLEDQLPVASISKPMAGLWIATLVDAGKITYDARALEVLPELKADCLPEHREVTLGTTAHAHCGSGARSRRPPRWSGSGAVSRRAIASGARHSLPACATRFQGPDALQQQRP